MSAAPETKYTERDVRDNPELEELAVEYVEQYSGEFEFLIDMKMRLAQRYALTTPMVKGILNCMRHDPRVSGLPAPLPPEECSVLELRQPRHRRRPKWNWSVDYPEQCSKRESHDGHVWTNKQTELQEWCEGIEYRINRTRASEYPAVVKVPFVAAQGGALVHRVANTGHWVRWWPNKHEWGFSEALDPQLWVNLVCRYPSVLKNPRLIALDQAEKMIELCGLGWCRHCNG
jgi:hypothetical protein